MALVAALVAILASPVRAHFKLLSPDSWLNEDSSGAPQKGGPCGPGGADDVKPVPMSNKVTTVQAGSTIMVKIQETIHHPGWFRIALAENRDDFKDPMFPNADCTVDMSTVPTGAHDNVLADGLAKDSSLAGANRTLMEMVKIPDKPCEKCTLQVIQVMADAVHRPPGCVYHHCADIKIVASSGSAAGSGGSAPAAGASGAAAGSAAGAGAAAGASGTAAVTGGTGAAGTAGGATAGTGTPASGTGGSVAASPRAGTGASATPSQAGSTATTPAPGAAGSTATTGMTTNSVTTAGMPATPPGAAKSGGCSLVHVGARREALGFVAVVGWVGLLFTLRGRRRAKRRGR